jgi:ubiquitin carboxyl-terminal hydrolase 20/33
MSRIFIFSMGTSFFNLFSCLGSDYAQLSGEMWKFFHALYGGGPELVLRQQSSSPTTPSPPSMSSGTKHHSSESLAPSKTGAKSRKSVKSSSKVTEDSNHSTPPSSLPTPSTPNRYGIADSSNNSSSLSCSEDELEKAEVARANSVA